METICRVIDRELGAAGMEAHSRQGGERIMARAWKKRKQANNHRP
jgi:hypothetical protein